jgi:hypothetical protein
MPRTASVQSLPFTWKETNVENVIIQNSDFSAVQNTNNNSTVVVSSTQTVPNWTVKPSSLSIVMIGRGSTIYNTSDASANQYFIGAIEGKGLVQILQSIRITTGGRYRMVYETNGRIDKPRAVNSATILTIPVSKKFSSIPNAANWIKETVEMYIPSPGEYTLQISMSGASGQTTSVTNISMYRYDFCA